LIICERLRIPSIPENGVPAQSEEVYLATPGSVDGIGEAEGARSGACGDNESKKGSDVVSSVRTRDLDVVDWGEVIVWEFFLNHDADCRAGDRPTAG